MLRKKKKKKTGSKVGYMHARTRFGFNVRRTGLENP